MQGAAFPARPKARGIHVEYLMNPGSNVSVPLWLLYEDEIEAWRAAQPPPARQWLIEQNFRAEKHRVVLLPDTSCGLAAAVGGLGKRQGELSLWHAAGVMERLPPRRFRLAQQFRASEATQLALGFSYGAYRFERYRSAKNEAASLDPPPNADMTYVEHAAESLRMARDWINTPAGDFGPAELAAAARQLGASHQADFREWVGQDLLAANFPAIHAVGRASSEAPRLVELRWTPQGGAALPTVTLVGKGVCFDSGGLDIKPGAGMALMKKDMGGAAIVLALARVIIETELPVQLRVILPIVENAVAGNAMRPLDIVRTRKGITVEIGNTDAEGRLILCDALAEADDESPDLLIDCATLTGAARVALGSDVPAFFTSDDKLAAALMSAGTAESDPVWRLPLWKGYRKQLDTQMADISNDPDSSYGGAITAALYLQEFVTKTSSWVHLDMMAWNLSARPGRPAGGEAMAVRALYALIREKYGK